jgi:hypothetical protein
MLNPRILIIPDIHGRDFYTDALKKAVELGIDIVCLGDYLDPYPYDELHKDGVSKPLKELLAIKKEHPHKVHLLIGNHDSSYMFHPSMCMARYDKLNGQIYTKLFKNNALSFDLFFDTNISGKRYLFSHAGITKMWMTEIARRLNLDVDDLDAFLEKLNYKFKEFCISNEKCSIWSYLSYIGEERGGQHLSGSMLWADFFEHVDKRNHLLDADVIQVVGHTQLNYHPVSIDTRLFCLDCREPFYVDGDGVIRSWQTDENIMTKYNILAK